MAFGDDAQKTSCDTASDALVQDATFCEHGRMAALIAAKTCEADGVGVDVCNSLR